MAVTGRTQAKKAKAKAAELKRISQFQKRHLALRDARQMYATTQAVVRSPVRGTGEESSGQQGVLSSVDAQRSYSDGLQRHSQSVYNQMQDHSRNAKKAATNFKVAAMVATVVTFGAAAAFAAGAAAVTSATAAASGGSLGTATMTGGIAAGIGTGTTLSAGATAAAWIGGAAPGFVSGAIGAIGTAKKVGALADKVAPTGGAGVGNIGPITVAPQTGISRSAVGPSGTGGGGGGYTNVPASVTAGNGYNINAGAFGA